MKVLVNRLAPLLLGLVAANQCVFIQGRIIHNHSLFLFVQQLARSFHRTKEPHILLKLDISKVLDSVSWSFLLEVLQQLGLGQKWCDLICLLLSTASTQILVNGVPGQPISHLRG
jgi:hypothetical protein